MPKAKPPQKRRQPPEDWSGFDEEWEKLQQRRTVLGAEWIRLEEDSRDLRKLMKKLVEKYRKRRKD